MCLCECVVLYSCTEMFFYYFILGSLSRPCHCFSRLFFCVLVCDTCACLWQWEKIVQSICCCNQRQKREVALQENSEKNELESYVHDPHPYQHPHHPTPPPPFNTHTHTKYHISIKCQHKIYAQRFVENLNFLHDPLSSLFFFSFPSLAPCGDNGNRNNNN